MGGSIVIVQPLLLEHLPYSGSQSINAILHNVIRRAMAQQGHGLLFADGARHDDEGNIEPEFSQTGKGPQRVKGGH